MKPLFLILAAALAAAPQTAHQHHPPGSAQEYARVLEDPGRDEWQKPHAVIEALALKPDEVIADVGAGSGYFARRFARHAGKVYAVDIDEGLLAIIRKDAPANLLTILAAPDDPRLPDKSVDTIFFCDVLHHINNRAAYLPKLLRALKPGGRVVNIDFYKKPLAIGPPVAMKLSEDQVIAEFTAAGLRLAKRLDLLPYQYFLIFNLGTVTMFPHSGEETW
jgi:ubiquinone/menaquinone biosynthesis C-methylase UbiE